MLRLLSPAPSALRCGFVVSFVVGWRRFTRPIENFEYRGGCACGSPRVRWFQSSFAAVRFFHEAAFPRFSTNEALTGSVSFNYSVPLPLYMYNVLSTRSRSLAARPAGRTPTLSSVCLSYPPRVLCCQNPCKMAPSDRHRSLCSAFKAAKDSLHRHVKLGPFRALQKSVPMGSFIAVILLAIADSDAA